MRFKQICISYLDKGKNNAAPNMCFQCFMQAFSTSWTLQTMKSQKVMKAKRDNGSDHKRLNERVWCDASPGNPVNQLIAKRMRLAIHPLSSFSCAARQRTGCKMYIISARRNMIPRDARFRGLVVLESFVEQNCSAQERVQILLSTQEEKSQNNYQLCRYGEESIFYLVIEEEMESPKKRQYCSLRICSAIGKAMLWNEGLHDLTRGLPGQLKGFKSSSKSKMQTILASPASGKSWLRHTRVGNEDEEGKRLAI